MPRTLQDILDERAAHLVGRSRELERLGELATGQVPLVAAVHGVAGVGKSTLLRAFAARARAGGACVLELDGGDVEPTEPGVLGAIGDALGEPCRSIEAAVGLLAGRPERVVIAVDTYERLWLVDDWLRRRLVPALPDDVRVVLAGREPLPAAWAASFGDLLTSVALANLPPHEAAEVLRRADVPEDVLRDVNRLARGHPLSLRLAASALAARPDLTLGEVTVPAVIDEIAALYLDGLDAATRRALDAAAVVRRPTLSLLAAMLGPDGDADAAWARLQELPFVETGPDGLVLHDTVRAAVEAALVAADPPRRRALRAAAFGSLREDARRASPAELWRSTADLLFLVDNPIVHDAFFPPDGTPYWVEPATRADGEAIVEITARHDGPQAARLMQAWWHAIPGGFRVARDRSGSVAAFSLLCEPGDAGARVVDNDPVASLWREDLRRRGLPRGRRVLFARRMLTRAEGEAPHPAQGVLFLDAKRQYMELRPDLRRVYLDIREPGRYPMLPTLGFERVAPPTEIGGHVHHSLCLEFGPRSVDGWLARLVAAELELDPGPVLDPATRTLRVEDGRIALTDLEARLVGHLAEHAGEVIPRATLLREVWGHQWPGGGNVLEVAVSGLRRKLGGRADLVETVRGVGYRWRGA